MQIFGLEIRAAQKAPRGLASMQAQGPRVVGPSTILGGYLRYGSTDRNWRTDAGQLESNSTVGIALAKIAQKVAQSQLEVLTIQPDGAKVYEPNPMLFAWTNPLPEIDETTLLKAVACSLKVYGNAYVYKVRSKSGMWIQSMPLAPWQVFPKSDVHVDGTPNNGRELITRYQVYPYGGGQMFWVDPSDMVHIRDGMIDPNNPALGMSALMACLRQVVSDNEAANYLATLLTNMGIPGVIFSPKDLNAVPPTDEQKQNFKQVWQSFVRDRRGQALPAPAAFDITTLGLSPTDMKAIESKVHFMTELLAALGIDPMVVGLPSESKTYANMEEAREAFVEDTILGLLSTIAKALNVEYVKEGLRLATNQRLAFNPTVYRELDEDIAQIQELAANAFINNGTTRGEYRKSLGLQTDLDDTRLYADIVAATKPVVDSAVKRHQLSVQRGIEVLQAHGLAG